MDALKSIGQIAASGLHAQSERMRIVAENVANASSTASTPGGDPYRRKTISFEQMVDSDAGMTTVDVADIGTDQSEFTLRYDPSHPAANADGYVKLPNVNPLLVMGDMREASRSYEANMNMLEAGRRMKAQILDLLS